MGQRISLVATKQSGGSLFNPLAVLKPDGTTLASVALGGLSGYLEPPLLPVSGTYTVLVDAWVASTGTGLVTLYNATDVTGSMTIGGPAVQVTLSTPGQRALLTFVGTAGQRINAVGTRQSGAGWLLFWPFAVLKPDGTTLGSVIAGAGPASLGPLTLPVSGTYSVLVDPYQAATGTASVTVTLAP